MKGFGFGVQDYELGVRFYVFGVMYLVLCFWYYVFGFMFFGDWVLALCLGIVLMVLVTSKVI